MARNGNEFIDVDQALGFQYPDHTVAYAEKDLILYALGVGAGRDPMDRRDLHLVYENDSEGFRPLPSFAVVPALNAVFAYALANGTMGAGLEYGFDRVLHGEQSLELMAPLRPNATLVHKARVTEIFDKGKHAIVITHVDSFDTTTNALLFSNDVSTLVRGAGGWGGPKGPSGEVNVPPERAPDAVVIEKTEPNQALLYRLSGDWNPLHADPEMAALFGFERPILHGLCTFGFVTRAVINAFRDGDPRTFRRIKVRFAGAVFPGETLKTEMWKESETRVVFRTTVVERGVVVISNAAVEFLHVD